MHITRKFEFERSTKNTHRFREVVPAGSSPVLEYTYVKKAVLPQAPPAIWVEVSTQSPAKPEEVAPAVDV